MVHTWFLRFIFHRLLSAEHPEDNWTLDRDEFPVLGEVDEAVAVGVAHPAAGVREEEDADSATVRDACTRVPHSLAITCRMYSVILKN